MLKPEEFVDALCHYDRTGLVNAVKTRDAEVREEKRKEVVEQLEPLLKVAAFVYDGASPATAARSVIDQIMPRIRAAKSLQPPDPDPSERAMRVAEKYHPRALGGESDRLSEGRQMLALLIHAEFGAGK